MPQTEAETQELETEPQKEGADGIIPFTDSRTDKRIYTNHAQILLTPWDFTFRLGVIEVVGGEVKAIEEARITTSPQHAKAIASLLLRQLTRYEERYGKIPEPGGGEEIVELDVPSS